MKRAMWCVIMILANAVICLGAVDFPYSTGFEDFQDAAVNGQFEWTGGHSWCAVFTDAAQSAEGQKLATVGQYNGFTTYIQTPMIQNTPVTGKIWAEFAFKVGTNNVTGNDVIEVKSNSGNIVYRITITPDNKLIFNTTEIIGMTVNRGQWYRYAVEINNDNSASLYVDQQNVGTANSIDIGTYGLGLRNLVFWGGCDGGGWPAGDVTSYVDDLKMGTGNYLAVAEAGPSFPYHTSFEGFTVGAPINGQFEWLGGHDWCNIVGDAAGAADGENYACVGQWNGWTTYIRTPYIINSPQTGRCWVEFAFKIGAENVIGDDAMEICSDNGSVIYRITLTPDNKLMFNDVEAANVLIQRGQWYQYAVEVDDSYHGKLYLNQQKVAEGNSLSHSLGIGGVYFWGGYYGGGWPAGDVMSYVDDLKMGAGSYVDSVDTPAFSPFYPLITGPTDVVITCATEGATIHYTTDGSDPTEAHGTAIASGDSVTVEDGVTLKAIAWMAGMESSGVKSITYTIPDFDRPEIIPYSSSIVVNGDLTEWSEGDFAPLDQVYNSDPYDIAEAYYAASWSSDGKIYVAVKVRDTEHYFTDMNTGWDKRDAIEIYIHPGNPTLGPDGYSGSFEAAQQFVVGVKSSDQNTVWATLAETGSVPAALNFQAAGKVVGQWIQYECVLTSFDYFGGFTDQPSIVSTLKENDLIGLDVCVASADSYGWYTGMKSENTRGGKSWDLTVFGVHKLGAAPVVNIPGDANEDGMVDVGDLGILAANYGGSGKTWGQGDFNGDGLVDVGDLGILAAHYGEGVNASLDFSADYAKVFGTTVADEESDEEISSSVCSGLGLPLVAGLMLMGLMLVKLEE